MNERSPGGNYSCPGTPNQNKRSYKWDEPEKGIKPSAANIPTLAVPENKNKALLQHSMEDVTKSPSMTSSKTKKGNGNCSSDPRFKRVISTGIQNDACVGTDSKSSKPSLVFQEKGGLTLKNSVRNIKEFKPNPTCLIPKKASEQSKISQINNEEQQVCEKLTSTDFSIEQSNEHLKAVDKLSFNHDLVVKSLVKESVSDCSVHTKNTAIVSDEGNNDFSNDLKRVPSGTRIKKVQNWICDQVPKMEKKLSVITVIGQTQGPNTVSSTLQEIDKRRKLVKELDRYAVCKKITESDKENENYDLISTINYLTTADKVLFPESNETLKNFPKGNSATKQKSAKDFVLSSGKLRLFFSSVNYQKMFCVLVLISGALGWFAFSSVQSACATFDLFNSKPKPLTWYEKICQWIWEFFRPSDSYHRAKAWHSY